MVYKGVDSSKFILKTGPPRTGGAAPCSLPGPPIFRGPTPKETSKQDIKMGLSEAPNETLKPCWKEVLDLEKIKELASDINNTTTGASSIIYIPGAGPH